MLMLQAGSIVYYNGMALQIDRDVSVRPSQQYQQFQQAQNWAGLGNYASLTANQQQNSAGLYGMRPQHLATCERQDIPAESCVCHQTKTTG